MVLNKILTLSTQLIAAAIMAQCPHDLCDEAFTININEPGYYCGPETTQGNVNVIAGGTIVLINHYCNDENGGNPSCWTSDHDYWISLNITSDGIYTFNVQSDYTNFQLQGGVHFAVYSGGCSALTEVWNPYCPQNLQTPNLSETTFLYAGTYAVQIDGFGTSAGTSQLCIMSEPILGLNIDELLQDYEPGTNWKLHVVRKYYLRR